MSDEDVKESRLTDRYSAAEPMFGTFGPANIVVVDLSDTGVQIEHSAPLRLATKARLSFQRGGVTVNEEGIVVWSRLAGTPKEKGQLLYRSGLRIESDLNHYAAAFQALIDRGIIHRDSESLDKKKRRMEEREQARAMRPAMKVLRPVEVEIDTDQALLIRHVRDRLRANPLEATRWYNRAKYAIMEADLPMAVDQIPYREEVLGVWEYLERSIDVSTILKVFQRDRR